jgi:hypothetical protein
MIAAGIVSSWTHASTLLTSCTLAYSYGGGGGGLWYGAVGTFQTLFFAVAAFKIKEKSNNAHTFPGTHSSPQPKILDPNHRRNRSAKTRQNRPRNLHFFGLVTNLINGSALAAGGCAVFSSHRDEPLGRILEPPCYSHSIYRRRWPPRDFHLRLSSHHLPLHLYLRIHVPGLFS